MFSVQCYRCHNEMIFKGAILYSPPFDVLKGEYVDEVFKFHLCVKCYDAVIKFIDGDK